MIRITLAIKRSLQLSALLLFTAGCGGGSLSSAVDDGNPSVSVALGTPSLSATMSDGTKTVSLTFTCSAQDLFVVDCHVDKVKVGIGDLFYDVPVNARMTAGESRTIDIPVFTNSHRELEPFNYLRDINPSTSESNWNIHSEVLASPSSFLVGTGTTSTAADPNDPTKQVTLPVNSFSSSVPAHTQGTVRVTDGKQVLDEETFGHLSGDGNGIVSASSLTLSFSSAPAAGIPIVGMYLPTIKDMAVLPQTTNLKVAYDDLILTQSGALLLDDSGNVYAMISGKKITPVRSMGFRNAPFVAVYEGSPYSAFGGALLGHADGTSSVFTMKTKYAPIVQNSVKVFTDHAVATIHLNNPYTGELTFSFAAPPAPGEEIKISYVAQSVNTSINLDVITSSGTTNFAVPFTVSK